MVIFCGCGLIFGLLWGSEVRVVGEREGRKCFVR